MALLALAAAPKQPSSAEVSALVSWRNRTLQALAQAGSVEKSVDAPMWALLPAMEETHPRLNPATGNHQK